jgi:hypothetical protein
VSNQQHSNDSSSIHFASTPSPKRLVTNQPRSTAHASASDVAAVRMQAVAQQQAGINSSRTGALWSPTPCVCQAGT